MSRCLAAELSEPHIATETQPIEGSGCQAWATYDILPLRVVLIWSDGEPDLDCTRPGETPRWTKPGYSPHTTTLDWQRPASRGIMR